MADNDFSPQAADMAKDGTATAATDVVRANQEQAAQAGLPDGPNVGPSPQEHRAAQGIVEAPAPSEGTGAGTSSACASPQRTDPEGSPEEQELVDEQLRRDRQASKSTDSSVHRKSGVRQPTQELRQIAN